MQRSFRNEKITVTIRKVGDNQYEQILVGKDCAHRVVLDLEGVKSAMSAWKEAGCVEIYTHLDWSIDLYLKYSKVLQFEYEGVLWSFKVRYISKDAIKTDIGWIPKEDFLNGDSFLRLSKCDYLTKFKEFFIEDRSMARVLSKS